MVDSLLTVVPPVDPLPLPAPIWLLKSLLLLTFLLHLIAMNWLLAGTWIAAVLGINTKSATYVYRKRLQNEIVNMLPTLVAATVTLGVAPLLFVQTLYGHLVYTSSIAIGWFWWMVVPLVIIVYYTFYHLKFKLSSVGKPVSKLIWYAAIILLWISFTYTNNFSLASQPERFSTMLLENSKGWWLNISDPTLFPRWLHTLLGATAISGVGIILIGKVRRGDDDEYGSYCMNLGSSLFSIATMANIIVGFIFMMTLRRDVMMTMMGRSIPETMLWFLAVISVVVAMILFKQAARNNRLSLVLPGTILTAVTLAMMVILRDLIRMSYQKEFFELNQLETSTQTGPMIFFFITFAVGLYAMWWLISTYFDVSKDNVDS